MTGDDRLPLRAPEGRVCASYTGDRTTFTVYENAAYRWFGSGGDAIFGLMSLARPASPVLAYARAMLASLLFHPAPRSVLNLGSGTGTFERFFHEFGKDTVLASVEVSDPVVSMARDWFMFPSTQPVSVEPADLFLAGNRDSHDLILCDLFAAQGHPPCLFDEAFYRRCAASLSAGGMLVINLLPDHADQLRDLLLVLRHHLVHTALCPLPDHRNIVIYASHIPWPQQGILRDRAAIVDECHGLDTDSCIAGLQWLPAVES